MPWALTLFAVSLAVTLLCLRIMIPLLKNARITGQDVNKPGWPDVPEMGGLAIFLGLGSAIMIAIGLESFGHRLDSINLLTLLAAFCTILIAVIVGTLDDLISLNKSVKAVAPLFFAVPLMAVNAGTSTMRIPFVGQVDTGIAYSLVLVPLGVAVAANAVNMLAGFNGLEAGMGAVATISLAIIAFRHQETTALVISLAATGALLATLRYNWYPAKVFVGDVGTMCIGTIIASTVIVGNCDAAGFILMVPYAADFFIKAANRFPSKGWWGDCRGGKLYCPNRRPKGLAQVIMKATNGISETHLTIFLIMIEVVCGVAAVRLFW